MKVGDRVRGLVTYLSEQSATITVDGVPGLLLREDCEWTRLLQPRNIQLPLTLGQEIECVVLKKYRNPYQLKLGRRQLTKDPFEQCVDYIRQAGIRVIPGTIREIVPVTGQPVRLHGRRTFSRTGPHRVFVDFYDVWTEVIGDAESLIPTEELIAGNTYEFYVHSVDRRNRRLRIELIGD